MRNDKKMLIMCIAAAAIMVTGCSDWYSTIPAFTKAKEGKSVTAVPYNEPYDGALPDTSELSSAIEEKAKSVESKMADMKDSYDEATKEVSEGMQDAKDNAMQPGTESSSDDQDAADDII